MLHPSYLTFYIDKTHCGPVIVFFLCNLSSFFSLRRRCPRNQPFSLLLINRYILAIQRIVAQEHLQYSFWSVTVSWTTSEALAPSSKQQIVAKTASKLFSLSNSSQKSPCFAVLMYALNGHPRYFKFKRNYQQYGPCFQTTFPFLMTMLDYL